MRFPFTFFRRSPAHPGAVWLRRVVILLAVVAGTWALAWLAVPPLLKYQLEHRVADLLGRQVRVAAVDFSPWSLELTLHRLTIYGAGVQAPVDAPAPQPAATDSVPTLQVERIYADLELQSLVRLAPVIDAVEVDQPVLHVRRKAGGGSDLDDIFARLSRPADGPEKTGGGARFALYNITLHGGSIDLVDDTIGRTHAWREVEFGLPFLSSLDSARTVQVQPRLAFTLNGSRFDSAAQATPFADDRRSNGRIQLTGLDLAPYLGYLPRDLPVRLRAGLLDADLQVGFEQSKNAQVRIAGRVALRDVRADDADGEEVLSWSSLNVAIGEALPLQRRVRIDRITLDTPRGVVHRLANGRFSLAAATAAPVAPSDRIATKKVASSPASTPARDQKSAEPLPPWQVSLAAFFLKDGAFAWRDDATQPAASASVRDVQFEASALAWPALKPALFKGQAVVDRTGNSATPAETEDTAPRGDAGRKKAAGKKNAPKLAAQADARRGVVRLDGSAMPERIDLRVQAEDISLDLAAPYLAALIEPQLAGTLAADLAVAWTPQSLQLTLARGTLDAVALRRGSTVLAGWKQLLAERTVVDVVQKTVAIGRIALQDPRAKIERDAAGKWMTAGWVKRPNSEAAAAASGAASASASAVAASTAPASVERAGPWSVRLQDVVIEGGAFDWRDAAPGAPVAIDITALSARMQNLAPMERTAAASPLTLSAQIGSGQTEPGRLQYQGTLAPTPLAVRGEVRAERLPLHALEPYFGQGLNLDLVRADASFRGPLRLAKTDKGLELQLNGDAALEDVRANSTVLTRDDEGAASAAAEPGAAPVAAAAQRGGERLLAWKALSLRGLEVAMAPASATRVRVAETALSDFFARVIVQESGRINLQDIVKPAAGTSTATPSSDPAATNAEMTASASAPTSPAAARAVEAATAVAMQSVAAQADPAPATGLKDTKDVDDANLRAGTAPPVPQAVAAVPGASAAATASAGSAAPAQIDFGPVSLVNGRVAFSDRFVRPNYSANLTELAGRLSAFSSTAAQGAPAMADLELRGKAEGTASLDITGKLNPLAKPLALDIEAKVKNLELPPLSPYAIKYVGHGIERGKLSMDLGYRIQPNGQLTATNRLVLNQLTFGDPVPGAKTSLPVRLAATLLADRNGVIDLDLPISGSLNDPQFRLFPIIMKVIGNVIVKAVTSPFSLLGGGGSGGSSNLDAVTFAPGSAAIESRAQQGLEKVAQVMRDRPALQMTVVGLAQLDAERDGYKRQRLQQLVRIEKRRALIAAGGAAAVTAAAAAPVASAASASAVPAAPVAAASSTVAPAVPAAAASSGLAAITVGDDEYPALLRQVYQRADMPKPRNLVGLAKDMPVAEMEALLLANIAVTDDVMRDLAVRRAATVRDFLAARQVPLERLFIGGSRNLAAAEAADRPVDKTAPAGGAWTPHAELQVSAR